MDNFREISNISQDVFLDQWLKLQNRTWVEMLGLHDEGKSIAFCSNRWSLADGSKKGKKCIFFLLLCIIRKEYETKIQFPSRRPTTESGHKHKTRMHFISWYWDEVKTVSNKRLLHYCRITVGCTYKLHESCQKCMYLFWEMRRFLLIRWPRWRSYSHVWPLISFFVLQ